MTKEEQEDIIKIVIEKLRNTEYFGPLVERVISGTLKKIEEKTSTLERRRGDIKRFETEIGTIKQQVEGKKVTVDAIATKADTYNTLIEEQKKEYTNLKEGLNKLIEENRDLNKIIKSQLGFVSTEVLSNSFFGEAEKLKQSVDKWFWWLFGSYLTLFCSVMGIMIWQQIATKSLLEISLLIRLPLITPIIFFVLFIERQYSRNRRLLDEYTFKATVARSFEAYRKLINEESVCGGNENQNKLIDKKFDFVVESIKDIYTSPTINLKDKDEGEIVEVNILEKVVNMITKIIK
jgi:hypothetical protein